MSSTALTHDSRHPRARRALALAVSGLAAVAASAFTAAIPAPAAHADVSLTSYVNPFIGTQDDGNTYPGASVPFGMVQFSPDNGHNVGYAYGNDRIRGFSLVHLSGAGCGIGGLLPVLPTTGVPTSTGYQDYALGYSHDDEEAAPGYYRVGLNAPAGTIEAELTATAHTAVQRYTYPGTDHGTVMLDAGQSLNTVSASSVRIVDARTVETTITSGGFCQGTEPFTVHTLTRFDRDIASSGTWNGDAITAGSSSADGQRVGAYVTFDVRDDHDVEAVTSLSYVDAAGAEANLAAEAGSFDDVRAAADDDWEQRLSTISVPTDDETQARVFYSALYRSFLAPNTGTDIDGRYRGWDGEIHTADGFTYYQNYSLWDTYRTQQQLLYLIAPKESRDMAISLVVMGEQYGWLPRWGYGPVETNIMTGDPGTAFLVSAWNQGLLDGYEERAYAVLAHNADHTPDESSPANGRAGNPVYLQDGYVPHAPAESGRPGDYDLQHGASATLEYALSDALLSTMAAGLGHTDDAERYAARGENYRSIFDVTTDNFRARDRSGFFVGDPDPAQAEGFHEGTAVQYQWLAPQDIPGLIDLLGGAEKTEKRLDDFFAYDQLLTDPEHTARDVWVNGTYSYYGQRTYNPNNEPDLHAPYLYQWTGQPWKTTDVVSAALTLFTDGPTGVTGNDDLGTMSAWYVLSSMGVYPIVPGSDVWGLSTPAFDSVDVTLDADWFGTDELLIRAPGLTGSDRYIQSVTSDRGEVQTSYLTGAELADAGTLTFAVGSSPSNWATEPGSAPGALVSQSAAPSRLDARVSPAQSAVSAGGSTTVSVEVLAQGKGTISGAITVDGSQDISAVVDEATWSLTSAGTPVSTSVPITLEIRPGVIAGTYPVNIHVSTDDGAAVDLSTAVTVADTSWLSSHFDNVGIGDAGQGNADFDGLGYYLLRDSLADLGFVQGAAGVVPGTDEVFVIPGVEAGDPDNIRANGQTLEVPDAFRQSTALSLVGSTNNGNPHGGGTMSLTYTDGTSGTAEVELSDWCTGNPADGNITVAKAGQRGDGHNGAQSIGCGIYATAPVPVAEGKTLQSVTLPQATNMHVFTVAFTTPNPVTPVLTAALSTQTPKAGESVTIDVTAQPTSASGQLVLSSVGSAGRTARAASSEVARVYMTDGSAQFSVEATVDAVQYRIEYIPSDATLFSPASVAEEISVQAVADGGDGSGDGGGPGDGDTGSGGASGPGSGADDSDGPGDLGTTGAGIPLTLLLTAALALAAGAVLRRRTRSL